MAKLILVRHGMSEWNKSGTWTGLTDISLCPEGIAESQQAAEKLKGIKIDIAFTSRLKRAKETLQEMLKILHVSLPVVEDEALNERDYGIFTGKNKSEVKKELGEERFKEIRRGWDFPIENGETLKDVYNRVVPYYKSTIVPHVASGKNVLIVAHGNSLRALVKYLEEISDSEISHVELQTGEAYIYEISPSGTVVKKEIR